MVDDTAQTTRFVVWASGKFFFFRFYYTNISIYFIFLVSTNKTCHPQTMGQRTVDDAAQW
jgi:hypothetical protein